MLSEVHTIYNWNYTQQPYIVTENDDFAFSFVIKQCTNCTERELETCSKHIKCVKSKWQFYCRLSKYNENDFFLVC